MQTHILILGMLHGAVVGEAENTGNAGTALVVMQLNGEPLQALACRACRKRQGRPATGRPQVPAEVGAAMRAEAAAVLPATAALAAAVAAACNPHHRLTSPPFRQVGSLHVDRYSTMHEAGFASRHNILKPVLLLLLKVLQLILFMLTSHTICSHHFLEGGITMWCSVP